jgi:hypothetical protein
LLHNTKLRQSLLWQQVISPTLKKDDIGHSMHLGEQPLTLTDEYNDQRLPEAYHNTHQSNPSSLSMFSDVDVDDDGNGLLVLTDLQSKLVSVQSSFKQKYRPTSCAVTV